MLVASTLLRPPALGERRHRGWRVAGPVAVRAESAERRADKTENGAPGAKRVSGGRPPRVAGGLAMPALPESTGTDTARRKGRTP